MADKPDGTNVPANKGPEQADGAATTNGGAYPENTPVSEMTDAQQAAYWKAMSRKHEDGEKSFKVEADRLKLLEDENAKLRQAQMSEQEKAVEAAKDEARREGENLGASAWQRVAVEEAVVGAAKAADRYTTDEDKDAVEALLSMIDPTALITQEGKLDRAKIEKALSGLAVKPQDEKPVKGSDYSAAVARQRKPGAGAGSVEAVRQAFLDAHTVKQT